MIYGDSDKQTLHFSQKENKIERKIGERLNFDYIPRLTSSAMGEALRRPDGETCTKQTNGGGWTKERIGADLAQRMEPVKREAQEKKRRARNYGSSIYEAKYVKYCMS